MMKQKQKSSESTRKEDASLPTLHVSNEHRKFDSIQAAQDHFSGIQYANFPVKLGECALAEDGFLTVANEKFQLTDVSLRQLLDKLHVPHGMARQHWPPDLLVHSVNRLLQYRREEKVSCWCNHTRNTFEAMTSVDFSPVRHRTLLNAYADAFPQEGPLEIYLTAIQLHIVKLYELETALKPDDKFKFGFELLNYDIYSETDSLEALSFLWRVVCENGAIAKTGKNYSELITPPLTEIELREKLKMLGHTEKERTKILLALKWMSERQIASHGEKLFKRIKTMVRKYIPLVQEEHFGPDQTYYDAYNYITEIATHHQDLPLQRRREVQTWAGSLIDAHLAAQATKRKDVIWEGRAIPLN